LHQQSPRSPHSFLGLMLLDELLNQLLNVHALLQILWLLDQIKVQYTKIKNSIKLNTDKTEPIAS